MSYHAVKFNRIIDSLIDTSLPRASGDGIRAHGHQATDVRDIGLGTASEQDVADQGPEKGARKGQRPFWQSNRVYWFNE
jgi:hypothetical protein